MLRLYTNFVQVFVWKSIVRRLVDVYMRKVAFSLGKASFGRMIPKQILG